MDIISSITWLILLLYLISNRNFFRILEKRERIYLREFKAKAKVKWNSAKVFILGDEGGGKTSTRKRLCNADLDWSERLITYVTDFWQEQDIEYVHMLRPCTYWTALPTNNNLAQNFKQIFEIVSPHLSFEVDSWIKRRFNIWTVFLGFPSLFILPIYFFMYLFISSLIYYMPLVFVLTSISGLIIQFHYVCIVSGGFSLSLIFKYLLAIIIAFVSANTEFCGPSVGQIIYNVAILLLFDDILASISDRNCEVLTRGIILGFVLVIHQHLRLMPSAAIEEVNNSRISKTDLLLICFGIPGLITWVRLKLGVAISNTIWFILMIECRITMTVIPLEYYETLECIFSMWVVSYMILPYGIPFSCPDADGSWEFFLWPMGKGLISGIIAFGYIGGFYCGLDTYNISILEIILSVMAFVALEMYMWKDVGFFFNEASVKQLNGICRFEKRWVLYDFPGNKIIYQDSLKVFLPKQGVFLVVFDASEFITNAHCLIERVHCWVKSVAIHVKNESNSVVVLVGTNKMKLNGEQLGRLSQALIDRLAQYKGILVFNKSTKMVFFIENMYNLDQEIESLQKIIGEEATKLPFVKKELPIRYHLFERFINLKRKEKQNIISKSALRNNFVRFFQRVTSGKGIWLNENLEDFDDILKFFSDSGDIFYEPMNDSSKEEYVIIDLDLIMKVIEELDKPKESVILERGVAIQWATFERSGVIDKLLLMHILKLHELNENEKCCDVLVTALKRNNVLSALPDQTLLYRNWYRLSGNPRLYASLTPLRAESVLLELFCMLPNLQTFSCKSATFRHSDTCIYNIRVTEKTRDKRRMLEISIRCEEPISIRDVAYKVKAEIENIFAYACRQNENEDQFELGYLCERCGEITVLEHRHRRGCTIETASHIITEHHGKVSEVGTQATGNLATVTIRCRKNILPV